MNYEEVKKLKIQDYSIDNLENIIPETYYLLEFDGGGYDGCIYERNYLLVKIPKTIEEQTLIEPLNVTGSLGKEFLTGVATKRLNLENWKSLLMSFQKDGFNIYLYDLESDEHAAWLCFVHSSAWKYTIYELCRDIDRKTDCKIILPLITACREITSYDLCSVDEASLFGMGGLAYDYDTILCDGSNGIADDCEACKQRYVQMNIDDLTWELKKNKNLKELYILKDIDNTDNLEDIYRFIRDYLWNEDSYLIECINNHYLEIAHIN